MTRIFMIFTDVLEGRMYDVMMYDVERNPDDRMAARR